MNKLDNDTINKRTRDATIKQVENETSDIVSDFISTLVDELRNFADTNDNNDDNQNNDDDGDPINTADYDITLRPKTDNAQR